MAAPAIEILADPRSSLLSARTGLLQAMHPAISDMLVDQPGFFDDPWHWLLDEPDSWPALQPDVLFWVHAATFDSMLVGADLFGKPMTAYEQERAYEESVQWYTAQKLSMSPVPPNLHAFREYWHHMLSDVLEPTEAVLAALRPGDRRVPVWIGRGLLPPEARATLGLEWSAAEERALQALFALLRTSWPLVPSSLRETALARRSSRWVAGPQREALLA